MNREKEFSAISGKTKAVDAEHDAFSKHQHMTNHVAFASVSTVDEEAMIMEHDTASETEYESEYTQTPQDTSHTTPRRTVYDERAGDEDVDDIETGVSIQIGPSSRTLGGGPGADGAGRRSTNGLALPMSADVDDILLDHSGSDGDGDGDGNGFVAETKRRTKRKSGHRFQSILQQNHNEEGHEDTMREGDVRVVH